MSSNLPSILLLVDGYNIIGAWPELKEMIDRHSLEAARDRLIEKLINYSAYEGHQTQLIFDAHSQNTPPYQEEHTNSLSVYYTNFAETADTYIEKTCAAIHRREKSHKRVIVATSDRAQQQTVTGYGAEWMSARQLVSTVEQVRRSRQGQHRTKQKTASRFLANSISPEAREHLSKLRFGK